MSHSPKMNFGNLPTESKGGIEPGIHHLVIASAKYELSQKGKPMLTLQVSPKSALNIKIFDRYTLFDENYKPESFGQFKLRKLLEAVNYIPKGDFTPQMLCTVLPDMEFQAELIHEEGRDGKTYLGIGDVESYQPLAAVGKPAPEVKPADFMPNENIKAELEKEDDELV